jgi:hypothetical protein
MTPFRPEGLINPSLNIRFSGGSKRLDGLNDGHLLKDFPRGILIIEMLLASLQPKEVEYEATKNVKRIYFSTSFDEEVGGLVFSFRSTGYTKKKGTVTAPLCFLFTTIATAGGRGGPSDVPLVFFLLQCLQQQEEGGAAMPPPPCVLFCSDCYGRKKMGCCDGPPSVFLVELVAGGGRGGPVMALLMFFTSVCCSMKKTDGRNAPPLSFFRSICHSKGPHTAPLGFFTTLDAI